MSDHPIKADPSAQETSVTEQQLDVLLETLKTSIESWALELGFQQVGFTDTQLGEHETHLRNWLKQGFHGEMDYMAAHGSKRSRPSELETFTTSVISLRMNYRPSGTRPAAILASDKTAYVARYSLGRDYHKLIRKRLVKLSNQIQDYLTEHGLSHYQARVFTDSAPILEKALAEKAGLGWIGKNTLLLNRDAGSWFFIGEIFTNLPFRPEPQTKSQTKTSQNHCGSCNRCLDVCPTKAFVGPYQLDARKCIAYLTIEHRGSIDVKLRRAIGNRIFGCDDCQIFCPWTKFSVDTLEADFSPRHKLDDAALLTLFSWTESEFLERTLGSAIRRTGYAGWTRNIAIALGNASYDPEIMLSLEMRHKTLSVKVDSGTADTDETTTMVIEHIQWALVEQRLKAARKI